VNTHLIEIIGKRASGTCMGIESMLQSELEEKTIDEKERQEQLSVEASAVNLNENPPNRLSVDVIKSNEFQADDKCSPRSPEIRGYAPIYDFPKEKQLSFTIKKEGKSRDTLNTNAS
jgi:hypothetical protein